MSKNDQPKTSEVGFPSTPGLAREVQRMNASLEAQDRAPAEAAARDSAARLRDFRNRLCILRSTDRFEIEEQGVRLTDEEWARFRDDPYRGFLRADDAQLAAIWAVMEARSK